MPERNADFGVPTAEGSGGWIRNCLPPRPSSVFSCAGPNGNRRHPHRTSKERMLPQLIGVPWRRSWLPEARNFEFYPWAMPCARWTYPRYILWRCAKHHRRIDSGRGLVVRAAGLPDRGHRRLCDLFDSVHPTQASTGGAGNHHSRRPRPPGLPIAGQACGLGGRASADLCFTSADARQILHWATGQVFTRVLGNAVVFKRTPAGQASLNRFLFSAGVRSESEKQKSPIPARSYGWCGALRL